MPELKCNPGSLLRREEVALVVIDVQDRLLPTIAEGDRVVANIVKLVRFFRLLNLPTIVTEQVKLGTTVPEIRAELPDVEPVVKSDFSCFGCEDFAETLRGLGRNALALTGIESHICVAQTALRALPEYSVHVVSDAISSRSPQNVAVAVKRMLQAGATITSTEMLIYELLQRAGTDEFRAALKLVKEG